MPECVRIHIQTNPMRAALLAPSVQGIQPGDYSLSTPPPPDLS